MSPLDSHPIRLRYFDCRGRAQPLRDLLHDRGVPFEDELLEVTDPKTEWLVRREDPIFAGPLGALPALYWGKNCLAEALAIAGLLDDLLPCGPPASPEQRARRSMFASAAYLDLIIKVAALLWLPRLHPQSPLVEHAQQAWTTLRAKLARIDATLPSAPEFLGGELPCAADFFLFEGLRACEDLIGVPALQRALVRWGRLADLDLALRERPAMAQSLAQGTRPTRLTGNTDEEQVRAQLAAVDWT